MHLVLGLSLSFALVLSPPTELLEEFELLPGAPLREVVTARATYARGDGLALLPSSVQGTQMPVVQAFGRGSALRVSRSARGWVAQVPEGAASVRLVARVLRPTASPRLFSVRWPAVGAYPARRVLTLPRDYIRQQPPGWTCPLNIDEPRVFCVATLRSPPGFSLSLPAPRSSAVAALMALGVNVAVWLWLARSPAHRALTLSCVAVGALVAASLSLTLVGALCVSWSTCALVALPLGALVGSRAPHRRLARQVGSLGAMVIPLLSATYGGVGAVLCAASACAVVVLIAASTD